MPQNRYLYNEKNCILAILYAVFGVDEMKIIWNEREKKKHKKLSKMDKRYHLKLWRYLNWWKKKLPEFLKEVEEVIGE